MKKRVIYLEHKPDEPIVTFNIERYDQLSREEKLNVLGGIQALVESEIIKLGKEPKPTI